MFGEVASLVMCDGGVSIKTFSGSSTNNGGFFSGLKKMLGGKNFFGLEFENRNRASEAKVLLSPNGIGEVVAIDLDLIPGNEIFIRRESYFAHIDRNIPISISASFGGSLQNLLFGTGLMTRIKGNGIVFVLISGSMIPVKLNSREKVSVDIDNLLMCTNLTVPTVEFRGFKKFFLVMKGMFFSLLDLVKCTLILMI